jgi:hypothetical protein
MINILLYLVLRIGGSKIKLFKKRYKNKFLFLIKIYSINIKIIFN